MLEYLKALTPEVVAGGFLGLATLGVVVRNLILGWAEARTKMREAEKSSMSPFTAVMSVAWDKNQVERALVALENMGELMAIQTKHMELVSKAQGIMSDQFQQTTQMKLTDILERMDLAEIAQSVKPKPVRRRRPKPKSTA